MTTWGSEATPVHDQEPPHPELALYLPGKGWGGLQIHVLDGQCLTHEAVASNSVVGKAVLQLQHINPVRQPLQP